MPGLLISFTKEAENDFAKIGDENRKRIIQKLEWLGENFDFAHHAPLAGSWRGFFKLRAGDWRIIYRADYDNSLLVIYAIGRRDKIYKLR
ncbi:MAG: type II toxin-antitoxin system RelE/ParE family toxin [Patescibacteria group bacterium]